MPQQIDPSRGLGALESSTGIPSLRPRVEAFRFFTHRIFVSMPALSVDPAIGRSG